MKTEIFEKISAKKEDLKITANNLLSEFSKMLESPKFNSEDSQDNIDNVIEAYFDIIDQYKAEVREFSESLFENPTKMEEKYIGLVKWSLHMIFNEKHNEFQQILKGHKDYAYIAQTI